MLKPVAQVMRVACRSASRLDADRRRAGATGVAPRRAGAGRAASRPPQELRAGVALRVVRAAVLAAVVVAASVAAHVTGGGSAPGPLTVSGLIVVCTAVLAGMLGRPASTARIVSLLCGGQLLLHVAFTVLGGHGSGSLTGPVDGLSTPAPAGADHAAHGTGSMPAPGTGPVSGMVQRLAPELTPAQLGMTLAHLAAVALLGLWLAAGERLVWRTVVLLARPVVRGLGRVYAALLLLSARTATSACRSPHGRRWPRWWPDPVLPSRLLLLAGIVRRGPPAAASC